MRHPPKKKKKLCSKQHLLHRSQLPFLAISIPLYPHYPIKFSWPHLILSFRRGGSILLYRLTLKAVDGRGNATRKRGRSTKTGWVTLLIKSRFCYESPGQMLSKKWRSYVFGLALFFHKPSWHLWGQPYNWLDDPMGPHMKLKFHHWNHVTIVGWTYPSIRKIGHFRWI